MCPGRSLPSQQQFLARGQAFWSAIDGTHSEIQLEQNFAARKIVCQGEFNETVVNWCWTSPG